MFNIFRRKKESEEQIEQSLTQTRRGFFSQIASLFEEDEITDDFWEDLEALLIQADVGVNTTSALLDVLQQRVLKDKIKKAAAVEEVLREEMVNVLEQAGSNGVSELTKPLHVILVVGVNGTGKTTSIAKLANYYRSDGKSVVLAAADTFRAAAIDQLKIWGERVGAPVISHQPGADPGAVAYDAAQASLGRNANVLIIDTAGRLHTKYNLMEELKKVKRSVGKVVPDAPHEVLLVIDATTGQNGLLQAQKFAEASEVTGIVLAKLDGTAKGGVAFAIAKEMGMPIRYMGTGETLNSLAEFEAEKYVQALFE